MDRAEIQLTNVLDSRGVALGRGGVGAMFVTGRRASVGVPPLDDPNHRISERSGMFTMFRE